MKKFDKIFENFEEIKEFLLKNKNFDKKIAFNCDKNYMIELKKIIKQKKINIKLTFIINY